MDRRSLIRRGSHRGARESLALNYSRLRERFDGVCILNSSYSREMATDAVASGRVDLVSFGRPFIANPDLVARLRKDTSLNEMMDQETLYSGSAHGYTDYSFLNY